MAKRLVVIGGTAAGLSAASKAKRNMPELEIEVYEKSGYVSYGACGLPYFVGNLIHEPEDLVSLTADQLRTKRGIPTYIHHEVTAIDRVAKIVTVSNLDTGDRFERPYDALVIATGAVPVLPPIPGIHAEGVHCLRTVESGIALKARVQCGAKKAVVIGGGFIGLEVAEELALSGVQVTLLEGEKRLLTFLNEEYAAEVERALSAGGVSVHTGCPAKEIILQSGRAVGVLGADGCVYDADLVLVAVGVRPCADLARAAGLALGYKGGIVVNEHLRTSDPSIWACGDCVQMRNLITGEPCYVPLGTTANKQGRIAGGNLTGEDSRFRGVLASQVTKVFDLYIASTGLSMEQARSAGFDPACTAITKGDRASYYPGGGDNHLYLVFDRHTGRLLGAQGIGTASVAGRINVLVAAITSGMTVSQLNELDLVYAPPVAPVYDPILIAASQALKKVDKK